jgi:hypothetical protein
MRRILRENGLSLVLAACFGLFLAGQIIAGHRVHNADQVSHGQGVVSLSAYVVTGHFLEALTENLESEFLQMFAYVLLTVSLYQKGSAESKKLDEEEPVDRDPRTSRAPDAPWPVRKGGFVLTLYEYSLSLAFLVLFLVAFVLHGISGARDYNQEQMAHGEETVGTMAYLGTSRFWFESFQNWQSEFFSIGAMVVLSIFLRQRGSPESKPVDAPHSQTGSE